MSGFIKNHNGNAENYYTDCESQDDVVIIANRFLSHEGNSKHKVTENFGKVFTFFIRKHNFYECLCVLYFFIIFTIMTSYVSLASVITLIPIIIIGMKI
jgi:hypothetical protein